MIQGTSEEELKHLPAVAAQERMGCYVRKRCPRAFGLLHCAMAQRSGADGGAETKADGGRFSGHTAALSRQAKQMYGSASSGTSNGVDRGNESEEMVSEAVARIVHATVDRTETAVKEEEVTTTELEDGSTHTTTTTTTTTTKTFVTVGGQQQPPQQPQQQPETQQQQQISKEVQLPQATGAQTSTHAAACSPPSPLPPCAASVSDLRGEDAEAGVVATTVVVGSMESVQEVPVLAVAASPAASAAPFFVCKPLKVSWRIRQRPPPHLPPLRGHLFTRRKQPIKEPTRA